MTAKLRRWMRPIALALLVLALAPAPIISHPARAQEPEPVPVEEKGTGRVYDGYIGTAVLVFLALFIVGKSARR